MTVRAASESAEGGPLYLGCAVWSNPDWLGTLFGDRSRSAEWLRQYSRVFNAVEGNSTFYALPAPSTVQRWLSDTPSGFRFCFKFPRTISHERQLRHAGAETRAFLDRLAPLRARLGPLMLQLPPAFGPAALTTLERYLDTLPDGFEYAVEVRHPALFAKDGAERALNRLLAERAVDRVILDSRALFSSSASDADTWRAQSKKPRLPVHAVALSRRPLVRFIGQPDIAANQPFLEPWVEKLGGWLAAGLTPYFFAHTPSNRQAPQLARAFHHRLAQRLAVAELPAWPGAVQVPLF